MKRFTLALTLVLAFAVSVAFASSGAELFNSKCAMCHAPDGSKIASASGSDMLKGQSAADIEHKLKGYVDGTYGGSKAKIMQKIASKLSEEELKAVAAHIGSL